MSDFKGKFLRVLTPRTTNGINLKMVDREIQYKEQHLPITALKPMQAQNARLPEHLRHILEIVGDDGKETVTEEIRPFKKQRAPRNNPQPGMGNFKPPTPSGVADAAT